MPPDRQQTGRSPQQIADHNSRTILEALRRSGPLTRTDLAALVGLTIPGISNVTRRLLSDGMIIETRHRPPNAQIPAAHYSLNPDGAFAIGARSRGGVTSAILVDLAGAIRKRVDAPDLAAAVAALRLGIDPGVSILGIGVAAETIPSGDDLLHDLPTVAATLAETTFGAGAPETGLAMILIEETIRAGLYFHGRPFAGVHGRAGRIGEMRTGNDRRLLDDVASTAAFRAAADGRAPVGVWIADAARHLLDALFAMIGFVAPGRIFIAGDLPPPVVEDLIAEMRRLAAGRVREADALDLPEISAASHGADSVLLGAALLPFFARLLPGPTLRQ